MSSLVRARDFELDRLKRDCEVAMHQTLANDNASSVRNDRQLHLSKLNEKIRVSYIFFFYGDVL